MRTPRKHLDNLVKALGESWKAHWTFHNVPVEDGATESKSAPAKRVSNAAKTKQMSGVERVAQVQALEKAGDALGDNPMLEGPKAHLTKEIENLRELKLDRNLGVDIERKKAFNERESARLLSLEESRIWLVTELSQLQQELDKQKKELEELCKTMAADTELPDMVIDSQGLQSSLMMQCVRCSNV